MNKISAAFGYLKRMHSMFVPLAKKEHVALPYLYYDFIKCFMLYGCWIDGYVRGGFYKVKRCERKKRLTYGRMSKVYRYANQSYSHILNRKNEFNEYFKEFIGRDWLYSEGLTYEKFVEFCKQNPEVIVKPADGWQGDGIYKLNTARCDLKREYEKLIGGGNALIESLLHNHPDMIFGNDSINTIRAYTFIEGNGDCSLSKCILRVGAVGQVVDNYCHGGACYEVEPELGYIKSRSLQKAGGNTLLHPGTDVVMIGRRIPMWDKVVDLMFEAHRKLPKMVMIAWDVAITENGPVLIEGNENPDYDLLEMIGSTGYWPQFKKVINNK